MHSLSFPDFLDPFPKTLRQEIETVRHLFDTEYGARCRIVGGAVRDRLLGRAVKDVDLEVYGVDPEGFSEAMERLGAQGVGKSFFVYKLGSLDIALPRKERKVAPGHQGFAVEPAYDEREASRRRDFTINALLYDLDEEKVLDYWGGLEDLERKRLRHVDSVTFVEDSLRVLRGMQFSARLGFRVDRETCRLCRGIPLDDLPGSRIFSEFEKMFHGDWPQYGLYALESMGISEKLWGRPLGHGAFLSAARAVLRNREGTPEELRPFCFLAIYAQHSSVGISRILEAIDAPNRYHRLLESLPRVPEDPNPSFVANGARKEGLRASVLGCFAGLRALAKEIGVWENPLEIGVTPAVLMERGFRGRALGEELERIRRRRLAELDTQWRKRKESEG